MEVTISPAGDGRAEDMASLRAWLETSGGPAWDLEPEAPADGGHLGLGVDEVCALLTAIEGLPALVSAIRGWFTTREESRPVSIAVGSQTITVDSAGIVEPVTIVVGSQTITIGSAADGGPAADPGTKRS